MGMAPVCATVRDVKKISSRVIIYQGLIDRQLLFPHLQKFEQDVICLLRTIVLVRVTELDQNFDFCFAELVAATIQKIHATFGVDLPDKVIPLCENLLIIKLNFEQLAPRASVHLPLKVRVFIRELVTLALKLALSCLSFNKLDSHETKLTMKLYPALEEVEGTKEMGE